MSCLPLYPQFAHLPPLLTNHVSEHRVWSLQSMLLQGKLPMSLSLSLPIYQNGPDAHMFKWLWELIGVIMVDVPYWVFNKSIILGTGWKWVVWGGGGDGGQRLLEFSQGRESVFPLERNKLWKVLQKSALPYFMSLDTFQCLLVYSLWELKQGFVPDCCVKIL